MSPNNLSADIDPVNARIKRAALWRVGIAVGVMLVAAAGYAVDGIVGDSQPAVTVHTDGGEPVDDTPVHVDLTEPGQPVELPPEAEEAAAIQSTQS